MDDSYRGSQVGTYRTFEDAPMPEGIIIGSHHTVGPSLACRLQHLTESGDIRFESTSAGSGLPFTIEFKLIGLDFTASWAESLFPGLYDQ